MRTKEEVIKSAWGEKWNDLPTGVQITALKNNGYVSQYFEDLLEIDERERKVFEIRPKSLSGIEDNNGWTKIESEEDLPKEDGDYHVRLHIGRIETFHYKCDEAYSPNYFESHVSHYQPIIKPEPPLY